MSGFTGNCSSRAMKVFASSFAIAAQLRFTRRESLGHTRGDAPPLIEFPADDPERALGFWRGVLGIDLEPRGPEAGAGWEAESDGLRLGVHERGKGPGDTASLPYFTVEDMKQVARAGHGARRLGDPPGRALVHLPRP